MRMMKKLSLALLITLLCGAAAFCQQGGSAGYFNKKQQQYIDCAAERAAILSFFFDPAATDPNNFKLSEACGGKRDKDKQLIPVPRPKWFEEELPKMMSRPVLLNTGTGRTLMENEIWRTTFANLYRVLAVTQEMWDNSKILQPEYLRNEYTKYQINLLVSTDRLNTIVRSGGRFYTLRDSMDGRARTMISMLNLANREMDSVLESFVSRRPKANLVKSTMAVANITNQMYAVFFRPPTPAFPKEYRPPVVQNWITFVLILLGVFFTFFAVFTYIDSDLDNLNNKLDSYLAKSNAWAEDFNRQFININVKYLVMGTLAVFALLGALFGFGIGGIFGAVIFFFFIFAGFQMGKRMPLMVLENLKRARGAKINKQFMDALILLSNSLKSGLDIVQGFEMVAQDLVPPISDEFGLVIKNYQLGTSFEKALEGMEDRIDSRLLSYMIKAVILQRQVGGNLPRIFERIVENIREESKIEEKLQALTAQQRIQAIVVAIMPWLMVGVMFLFTPDVMIRFYVSPLGLVVLLACATWIVIGMKFIQKLGQVKV